MNPYRDNPLLSLYIQAKIITKMLCGISNAKKAVKETRMKSYEYVIAVAQHGGISQAAEALNIAQPALSRYIRKLESDLGIELFDRSTIPIRMTQAGSRYVETGMRMLSLERQLHKQVQELKRDKNTLVRIGISPTRSPYMMPSIVEAYSRRNPKGCVVIEEKTSAELNKLLAQGDLDLMISFMDENTETFDRTELFEENILLAVPTQTPQEDALEAFLTLPLITAGKGQAMWHITQEITETLGIHMPKIECQSIETALAFVKRGLGATLVPSYIAHFGTQEQNRAVRFLELPVQRYPQWKTAYKRKICLFYRKEQFLSQAEQDFIACALEVKRTD